MGCRLPSRSGFDVKWFIGCQSQVRLSCEHHGQHRVDRWRPNKERRTNVRSNMRWNLCKSWDLRFVCWNLVLIVIGLWLLMQEFGGHCRVDRWRPNRTNARNNIRWNLFSSWDPRFLCWDFVTFDFNYWIPISNARIRPENIIENGLTIANDAMHMLYMHTLCLTNSKLIT